MRAVFPLLAFAVVLLVAYVPEKSVSEIDQVDADTTWTWPERSQNLQVLPPETGPFELSQVMRGFTRALGVRCQHCHIGTEEMSLAEFDFVSDANPHKNITREMMELVADINDDLSEIQNLHDADGLRVTCYTCHRGDTRPETNPAPPQWSPPSDDDDEGEEEDDHDHEGHDH